MTDVSTELYLVLGAAGSDRRRIVADLIGSGLPPETKSAVLLCAAEAEEAASGALRAAGATVATWTWRKPRVDFTLPAAATVAFFVADGRANPIDQIEALREWILAHPAVRLARVLLCLNASLARERPELLPWFEACAHYADVVLLTRTTGLDPRWLAGFEKRFRDQHYPFLCEVVRDGTVENPAVILAPEARRLSQVFDEPMELADETDEEAAAARPENDRYFARKRGGARVVEVPDIAEFV